MKCSMPGFPVLHCRPEFAQTRVHWVSDAIQSSHPLLPPSPLVLNLSGSFPLSWLFGWFTSSDQSIGASASVLPMSIQGWFPLGFTGLISLLSKGLSRVFSSTTSPKHQIFITQPSLWASQVVLVIKNLPANAGDIIDTGLISGLGISFGGGHGTHSNILAWRIPRTEESSRLQSIGSHRIGHNWNDLAFNYFIRIWKNQLVNSTADTTVSSTNC